MGVEDLRMVVEQMLTVDSQINKEDAIELKNIVLEDRILSQEERSYLEDALQQGNFSEEAAHVIRELLDTPPRK